MVNWFSPRCTLFAGIINSDRTRGASVRALTLLLAAIALFAASCDNGGSGGSGATGIVHFVPNSHAYWSNPAHWTTDYGPAYANIILANTNFVPCRGGPYALCYYSGPSSGPEDLSCTLTANGKYANCNCFAIPYGVYFVDINAILNHSIYEKTISQRGSDGGNCQTINSAPVCKSINTGTLMPNATMFSAFSFDCVPENGLGQTNCATAAYVGCMTAPCFGNGKNGIVQCSCPTFNGPYQVGQNDQACMLGDSLVWSAAYAPFASMVQFAKVPVAAPAPSPGACVPDAPGAYGCPLYTSGTVLPPDSGVDCQKVCQEYDSCRSGKNVESGYTCDATLCSDECNDRDLLGPACSALPTCDLSEIVKAETAAQCSCCASQLCGCSSSGKTNNAIAALNQAQRSRGITPQCDINGTLCGTP